MTLYDMAQAQVSVWVPIVVALLGIAGVVAGQIVSAWREDRRWQRERTREDLRWQREQEREARRLEAEDRSHWRDQRLGAYTAFMDPAKRWVVLMSDAESGEGGLQPEIAASLEEEVRTALASVLLVGSSELQYQCEEFYERCHVASRLLLQGEVPAGAGHLADAYTDLVHLVRAELGSTAYQSQLQVGLLELSLGAAADSAARKEAARKARMRERSHSGDK
ncbi:hypothetical protein [Nonomuraea endophytica]|uniref:hypothetical protein n=1 Tax=Nonomuraea endophytica TaxID=714136 RepID=UPI0037C9AD5B